MVKIILTALLAVILYPHHSKACSCARFDSKAAFKAADMVFLGTVVGVERVKVKDQEVIQASFKVEKSWKGVTGHRVQLQTTTDMCGSHFEVGKKLLQYGYKDFNKNNVCNGSSVAESAAKTIKALGKPIPLK